jgi:arylformamidase
MPSGLYDISPKLTERLAVFPGDVAFSRHQSLGQHKGDHLDLSSIHSTLHIGAHTDAPNHYSPQGKSISERDLSFYLGECQVVDLEGHLKKGARILPSDLKGKKISAKRVLFKTGSFPNPEIWNEDFNSLSTELVEKLSKEGVVLVGIDTPSIDPATEKNLSAHHAVFAHDLAILEGIVLSQVPEGNYTLIALPLPIVGGDASPVRAVLLDRKLADEIL